MSNSNDAYLLRICPGDGAISIPNAVTFTGALIFNGAITLGAHATPLQITGAFTTGITIAADGTIGISITSAFSGVTMISLAGTGSGDGILISGVCADAIHISGTNTVSGLHISGDQAIGILYDVDAAATDGLKILVDDGITLTTGINIDRSGTTGICTTGISIDTDGTTGIEIAAGFTGTTMLSLAGTATDGINISGICGDGIEISASATVTGINISADCVIGITVGAQTTTGISIGAAVTCIDMGTPTGSIFKMIADDTIVSDANQAILVDISATANAGFIKVILDTSTVKYIALYDLKAA